MTQGHLLCPSWARHIQKTQNHLLQDHYFADSGLWVISLGFDGIKLVDCAIYYSSGCFDFGWWILGSMGIASPLLFLWSWPSTLSSAYQVFYSSWYHHLSLAGASIQKCYSHSVHFHYSNGAVVQASHWISSRSTELPQYCWKVVFHKGFRIFLYSLTFAFSLSIFVPFSNRKLFHCCLVSGLLI